MISYEYLAGFIDGEGHIGLSYNNKNSCALRVNITNTNINILLDIQKEFGGKIRELKRQKLHWKRGYYVYFNTKESMDVINKIAPFVRVKKRQVELVLEYWKFHKMPRKDRTYVIKCRNSGAATTFQRILKSDIREKEIWYGQQMSNLNKRGE